MTETGAAQDFDNLVAIGLLGSYLYDGAISPLYRELVEIDEPYCTDIYLDVNGRSTSILSISASSVPTERLDEMTTKVREVLSKVATDGLDMQRMHSIIERDRLKVRLLSSTKIRAHSRRTACLCHREQRRRHHLRRCHTRLPLRSI